MAYFSGFVILDGSNFYRHASIVRVLYSQTIDTHTLYIVVRLLNYSPTYDVLEFGEPCCPIVVYLSHQIMSIFTASFIHFSFLHEDNDRPLFYDFSLGNIRSIPAWNEVCSISRPVTDAPAGYFDSRQKPKGP